MYDSMPRGGALPLSPAPVINKLPQHIEVALICISAGFIASVIPLSWFDQHNNSLNAAPEHLGIRDPATQLLAFIKHPSPSSIPN